MKRISIILLFFLMVLSSARILAKDNYTNEALSQSLPWLTGPLIADDGHTIPLGYINIQPFFSAIDNYGIYNSRWNIQNTPSLINLSPLLEITLGTSKYTDIELEAPYNYNTTQGQSASALGDTTLIFGFQLLQGDLNTWMPDLRFTISETFPVGPYQNLNPSKLGANVLGMGSYQTSFAANFQKLFQFRNNKYLMLHFNLTYTIFASTHVSGFNAYGGGFGTKGRVKPGNNFIADFAFEYTLTNNWVPAMDIVLSDFDATTFKGFPGLTASGIPATVSSGSSVNLSLAPAMEYNFSQNVGMIGGLWFSVAGRNSLAFLGGLFSVNFYYGM